VNHGFAWPASLQDLVLRANSLSNNIVSSLNGLTRLESLDLSVNNLKGSLDISGEYCNLETDLIFFVFKSHFSGDCV
jgi:Leucine-rich repeat (LRR) protein